LRLDTASATTTIDLDFAIAMGITLENEKEKEFIYVDRRANVRTAKCSIKLLSQDLSREFNLKCTAIANFSDNCCVWPWSKFLKNHEHLKNIDIPPYPEPPFGRILIGVDHPELLVFKSYAISKSSGAYALQSPLP